MAPERVGIIGLGHIGKFHIRAIQQFEELDLIAVCDRRKEFESLAPDGVNFHVDYHGLLNDGWIQTVIIATPNHTHYFIAREVLKAGKNVILEKPAAESMIELQELESTAAQKGLYIYYAFHAATAFDVSWFFDYYTQDHIRDSLGPLTGFYSRFYDPYINKGNLVTGAEGLQNCWMDSGINAISVIQRFIDLETVEIENVSAAVNPAARPKYLQCHAEYSFSINGHDRSGVGVIDTNWTTGRNHKSTLLSFGATFNAIRIDHSRQKVIQRNNLGEEVELADLSGGENRLYNHYLGVFLDFLHHKKLGLMNGDMSVRAHRLLFDTERTINGAL